MMTAGRLTVARRRSSGRRNAVRVVYEALEGRRIPGEFQILRVVFLGEGLTYRTWGVEVEWAERGERQAYMGVVARIPHRDSEKDQPERARREEGLLHHLATLDPPFEIPEPIGLVENDVRGRPRLAVVQGWVEGMPLDFKVAGINGDRPWEVVARVATYCHQVDPEPLAEILTGYPTRRDHALASLDAVAPASVAELAPLRIWGEAHLPPATPARLLHGDLLGQNLTRLSHHRSAASAHLPESAGRVLARALDVPQVRLRARACGSASISGHLHALATIRGEKAELIHRLFVDRPEGSVALPLGVIDWEYAEVGDPAFDLAVATRGRRRPFAGGSLRDLVDAYNHLAPEPVQLHEVRLHELCILARNYRAARDEDNPSTAENELRHIHNLISKSG